MAILVSPSLQQPTQSLPPVPLFDIPANPGHTAIYAPNDISPQIAAAKCLHKIELEEFIQTRNVKASLKHQLLATVNAIYLAVSKNPHVGYANVPMIQLLNHLFANYGVLHSLDLMANNAKMYEPWEPATPHRQVHQNC
jgi:hypothetical protein